MYREITLVRHGETVSNVAGVWQGQGNSGFSSRGREQVKRVAERLGGERFDAIVSSDLGRAQATAGALGVDFDSDPGWREMHLGTWEGLTREEVMDRYPDELAAFRAGADLTLGGGESLSELRARSLAALDRLVERLPAGGRALVVSHGGPIISVVADVLGVARGGALHRVLNTSLARVRLWEDGRRQVVVYNDAAHLDGAHEGFGAVSQAVLIRHGETVANAEGRWQGRENGQLTARGIDQIRRLGPWVPKLDGLYSSPASRAMATAAVIADRQNHSVEPHEGVAEIDFGAWEGLNAAEISSRFPDEWARFRVEGRDDPRGGSGERFVEAGGRMAASVERIMRDAAGKTVGIVSHGGVTRAYVATILGLGHADRGRLALPGNTSMTRIAFADGGPALAEYNLTPHLTS